MRDFINPFRFHASNCQKAFLITTKFISFSSSELAPYYFVLIRFYSECPVLSATDCVDRENYILKSTALFHYQARLFSWKVLFTK